MRKPVCLLLLTLAAACNSNPSHVESIDVYKERAFTIGVKTCVEMMSQDMATTYTADGTLTAAVVPDDCSREKRAAYTVEVDAAAKSFLVTATIKGARRGDADANHHARRQGRWREVSHERNEGRPCALADVPVDDWRRRR